MAFIDPQLRRALEHARPYVGALVPVVVLSLLGTALNLVLPYLSKLIVDDAILAGNFGALLRIVGLFVAITASGFAVAVSGIRRGNLLNRILSILVLLFFTLVTFLLYLRGHS